MKLIEVTFVKDASKKDYRKVLINPDMIVGIFKEDEFSIIKFNSNAKDLTGKNGKIDPLKTEESDPLKLCA